MSATRAGWRGCGNCSRGWRARTCSRLGSRRMPGLGEGALGRACPGSPRAAGGRPSAAGRDRRSPCHPGGARGHPRDVDRRCGEDDPLTDGELRDQVMTLLVAGHETTATTLAWCLERLQRHPDCRQRLQQEVTDGAGERYLDAVVNETLRTRPVIDWRSAALAAPPSSAATCSRPGIRWRHRSVASSAQRHSSAPRSSGPAVPRPARTSLHADPVRRRPRRCIGASFAVMEMKTILRTMLQQVTVRASIEKAERPVRWRRFTITPARGGRVTGDAAAAANQPEAQRVPRLAGRHGVLLQRGERNDLERPLMGGRQHDVGGRSVFMGAQPVQRRHAPAGRRAGARGSCAWVSGS